MALRTQVQTYSLIGNLADLPNPASVPQGYLFHAVDTGDCLILVIDPATGIRSWQEFCGATGMTGIEGPALLKWAGGADASALIGGPVVIGDTPTSLSVASGGVRPAYPLARARTALNFSINVRQNQTLEVLTVGLLINGVLVVALAHTFTAGFTGVFTIPGPVAIPAGSQIDVQVAGSGASSGNVSVSATLELF